MSFADRRLTHEFMDDPHMDRAGMDEALRFIRLVNSRLGGAAAALWHLKRWACDWPAGQTIRILDVGTGSADIPVTIADWATRQGRRVHVTGVDLHPVTVALAREFVGSRDDITIVQADALKLLDVFQPGQFDYAHAGMFLHHLADADVIAVLRQMDQLAARGVIWNDLVRGWVGRLGVRVLTLPIFGTPAMVRHDGIVSVAAGFTRREATDLARRAGLQDIRHRRHMGYRFTLAAEHKSTNQQVNKST